MKHLKEYEENEIGDLISDLKTVGLSEWGGYFITFQVGTSYGVSTESIAVVGESFKKIALLLFNFFNLDPKEAEINPSNFQSIGEIIGSIKEYFESDMAEPWKDFDFVITEMTPKKLENRYESADLLSIGSVIEMGRSFFSDFDSKILQHKSKSK